MEYLCNEEGCLNVGQTFKGESCLSFIMPQERSRNIDTLPDFTVAEHYLSDNLEN